MKTFIYRNESFECKNCGMAVPPSKQSCRNHCTKCLYSLHLDVNPGDRLANCGALMLPAEVGFKGGLPAFLRHKCTKSGHSQKNKLSEDDDREELAKIMENWR